MTKHLNTAQEIVAGWESGEPVAAICGYERPLIEGQPAEGDICAECAQAADVAGFFVPTRVLEPGKIRALSKEPSWSISRWTYEGEAS